MTLLINDACLKTIIKKADKLKLPDTAAVSVGVWTHVPKKELTEFNLPEFIAIIKFDLSEIKNAIIDDNKPIHSDLQTDGKSA